MGLLTWIALYWKEIKSQLKVNIGFTNAVFIAGPCFWIVLQCTAVSVYVGVSVYFLEVGIQEPG